MIDFFGIFVWLFGLMLHGLADAALVIARLKVTPPTGDPVWRWRLR